MIIRQDITVRADDEAGTGGLIGIAVAVAACGFCADGDTDGGVDILFIDICGRELSGLSIGNLRTAEAGKTCEEQEKL